MLAGAYPSDEFAELKPRVVWDRVTDTVEGRRDARVVAVTSGGTIPDRGLFGVFMAGEAGHAGPARRRARRGDGLRAPGRDARRRHHPRRQQLAGRGHRPRPGDGQPGARACPGKLPFWKGDAVGRPIELGRAMGAFVGEVEARPRPRRQGPRRPPRRACARRTTSTSARPRTCSPTSRTSARSTGALPTDRRIVVERFRDELGDWRLCLLTPFGGRVHAPWSLALEARLRERLGTRGPDHLVGRRHRHPAARGRRRRSTAIEALLFPDAGRGRGPGRRAGRDSALFASRFRENAARALLLPRRRPGTRTPLWQQRQRAADLLAVASRYGSFPILVETYRECLSDVFDLPALREVLGGVARREIAVHGVETAEGVAVREQPPVRLRGRLHVRRRRAAGRAPGRRADPRPRPAPRAARPGGAARAARPGGAGRPRAVASRR